MRKENPMSDEEFGRRLLAPLRDEPDGVPAIDLPRAMAEGLRRRRLRRWSSGAAVVAATAAAAGGGALAVSSPPAPPPPPSPKVSVVPTSAPGPIGCRVTRLPTDGVAKALVTGGDPSGHYLTGRLYPGTSSRKRTVIWKDGAILAYPALGGSDASFQDVNGRGVAVGSAYDGGEKQHAYVYRDGAVTRLRGGEAAAVAINDAGVIAGNLGPGFAPVPGRWASAGANATKLPLPAGMAGGEVAGIAEDGTIVGTVAPAHAEGTGYLWLAAGNGRRMPLPTVDGRRATFFWPESIGGGWVVGRAVFDTPDGLRRFTSMRYTIGTGTYERLAADMNPPAIGAPNGWILGTVLDTPAVLAGTKVVRLPAYQKHRRYVVSSFSADGRVAAGYSVDGGTDTRVGNLPLMWTCA